MVMYLPEERPVLDLPYQMNHLANNYGYYPQGKTVFTFLTFWEVQIQFQGYLWVFQKTFNVQQTSVMLEN